MWPQVAVSFLLMVVSSALQAVGRQQPQQKTPEPGKLDIPSAEEGGPVPVIFGTCLIKNSNVVWYGDASTTAIKSQGGGKK